jgi:hypothetical protein
MNGFLYGYEPKTKSKFSGRLGEFGNIRMLGLVIVDKPQLTCQQRVSNLHLNLDLLNHLDFHGLSQPPRKSNYNKFQYYMTTFLFNLYHIYSHIHVVLFASFTANNQNENLYNQLHRQNHGCCILLQTSLMNTNHYPNHEHDEVKISLLRTQVQI